MGVGKNIICILICLLCCLESYAQSSDSAKIAVVPFEEATDTLPKPATDAVAATPDLMPQYSPEGEWNRLFRLKTNGLGWLLLISNITAEIDLNPNWSLSLEIDYSGIDYFTPTMKFRIFGVRPEVRYWFTPGRPGWWVGAHLGGACWNFAFGGEYRYQDELRRTPAIGGGISAGYRMPISKDRRWEMEFGLGIGVYGANHNRFVNEKNGKLVDAVKKVYFGPDFIGVSFAYAFDAYKKQKATDPNVEKRNAAMRAGKGAAR